jgi:hypothetical protein
MIGKKDIEDYSKEDWDTLKKEFEEDYELEGKLDTPFYELMGEIFKDKGVTSGKEFSDRTGFDRTYYSLFRSKNYKPEMRTFITVCMALDIDIMKVMTLLDSIGAGFKKDNKIHYAYYYLALNYRGEDIENCNKILDKLGVQPEYLLGRAKK